MTPRRQDGLTLIEVLITLFVFAIGLLTVAGLQGVSKKSNYEAVQRTSATLLAYDMAERMRANSQELATYLTAVGAGVGGGVVPAPGVDCDVAECEPDELAEYDVYQWERSIDGFGETNTDGVQTGGLVSPTACITGPAAGVAGSYTIAIAWRGVSDLSNPTIDGCGEGSGKYGDSDEYRRVLVIETYITPT